MTVSSIAARGGNADEQADQCAESHEDQDRDELQVAVSAIVFEERDVGARVVRDRDHAGEHRSENSAENSVHRFHRDDPTLAVGEGQPLLKGVFE